MNSFAASTVQKETLRMLAQSSHDRGTALIVRALARFEFVCDTERAFRTQVPRVLSHCRRARICCANRAVRMRLSRLHKCCKMSCSAINQMRKNSARRNGREWEQAVAAMRSLSRSPRLTAAKEIARSIPGRGRHSQSSVPHRRRSRDKRRSTDEDTSFEDSAARLTDC